MGNLTDTELSRVLHDIVPTPPVEPGRMESVRLRVRRTQRRRRAAALAGVVAAVAAVAAVPSGLLDRSSDRRAPVLSAISHTPPRGELASTPGTLDSALTAWRGALRAAHRSDDVHNPHLLYAGDVAGSVVVVLAGVAPHAGDRLVVLTGDSAQALSVYADTADLGNSAFRVLLGTPPTTDLTQREYTACTHKPSTDYVSRPLLMLTAPGATSARWQTVHAYISDCTNGAHQINSPWTRFALDDGAGWTTVRYTAEEELFIDGGDASGGPDVTAGSGVETLDGARVDTGAQVQALSPPVTTETLSSDGSGASSVTSGGLTVARGPDGRNRSPSPVGWQYRYDSAQGADSFQPLAREMGGATTGQQVLSLAAPDGSLVGVSVARSESEQRVGIVSTVDGRQSLLLNEPLDSANIPKQLSAVYSGRDGNRWLFVAGAPGTYDIAYRAPGSLAWLTSDYVFMSSTFIPLQPGDDGEGQLRLTRADGTVVYEGPISR